MWLEWHRANYPDNATEIGALEADGGRYLGYTRVVGRRCAGVKLEAYCWPDPPKGAPAGAYVRKALLRE